MFTISAGAAAYFANNEDCVKPGVIWFVPGNANRFGRVNLGVESDFAQGSMNEKGLCFDAAVVPEVPWAPDASKKNTRNLLKLIVDTCATVDEAVAKFGEYNCAHLSKSQFMFADATGASAVVSWDPPGRLVVTKKQGAYQLITNDRIAWSGLRDQRFMLGQRALDTVSSPSPEACRDVLKAMRQLGKDAFTSYSNVFDLKHGKIYLFNLANYDEMVVFDLGEELKKDAHTIPLADVFHYSPSLDDVRKAAPVAYKTEIVLPSETLARYAGKYQVDGRDIAIDIGVDGARGLTFRVAGQRQAFLYPETDKTFRFRDSFGQVTFDVGSDGKPRGFVLHRPGDSYSKRVGD